MCVGALMCANGALHVFVSCLQGKPVSVKERVIYQYNTNITHHREVYEYVAVPEESMFVGRLSPTHTTVSFRYFR